MLTAPRALPALLLLASPLAACSDDGPAYDQKVASYPFEKAHQATLPDGERIAVGSRTGHDISVQWGDGDDWSAPKEVASQARWTHHLTVKERKGTVAITADFWDEKKLDDDYSPRNTVVVVCRDHACKQAPAPKRLSFAYPSDDGTLVSFGIDEQRMGFWEDGKFRTQQVSGVPKDFALRMADDGSFLAIGSREVGSLCHYDLYAAPHGSVAFTLAAKAPGFPDRKPCDAYAPELDDEDRDRVSVHVDSAVDLLVFSRTDGAWEVQVPEVPPIAYPDTHGRSTIAPVSMDGLQGEVLVGSPDLQRIVAQVRRPGSAEWSQPQTIAEAPSGHLCRWATGDTTDDGSAMVLVYCYLRSTEWKPRQENLDAPIGLVLATDDGETWSVQPLAAPKFNLTRGTHQLLAQGTTESLAWGKGYDAFQAIHLPSDSIWDQVTLIDDGSRVLLLSGNGDPNGVCRPGWTVVDADARRWPQLTYVPARVQRDLGRGTCSFEGYLSGEGRVAAEVSGMDFSRALMLKPDGDGFRLRSQ